MREEDAAVVVVAAFCRPLLLFQTKIHSFIYSFARFGAVAAVVNLPN